ncbi:MAG: glycerol-3-phosphate 1-O-acyltransferase PlsY [Acidobacteria bacterium]|nr:glycerol-3-phosphate 1-O-acyltransferase PlsY [Acidobacteriota bacterium]
MLASALIGYLLGSIPFGYLLVRWFHGADVRATGSGNIGATNVARRSPGLGVVTLLFDSLKGALAVWLARAFFPADRTAAFLAAFAAIAGHVFPVWLRFRGGKGVATGLGSFLLLAPKSLLVAIGIFIALVLAFRYVSLGSIVSAGSFPLVAFLLGEERRPRPLVLLSCGVLLIIVKHRANIRRLLSGGEPKFKVKAR